MIIKKTSINECYEIIPNIFKDERGSFVKTFNKDIFIENKLETDFKEEYYSVSKKNVFRGMHFQIPPMDHTKIVYCISGNVLDVILDLRKGSLTYGKYQTFELNSETCNIIYIPTGLAHGFLTLSDSATMVYNVSSVHSSEHDCGVHWNSFEFNWPTSDMIISNRDNSFVNLKDFKSPFIYKGEF